MFIYHELIVIFHSRCMAMGLALLFLVGGVVIPVKAQGTTLPSGFTESLVAGGISIPTTMAFAPDGRLFVAQQSGALRVIQNDVLLPTPFLSLTVDQSGERGLLGVAFDPSFTTNHYIYVYYTVPGSPPHNRVSRFTANGNVVVPGSEVMLLELNNLTSATNHNGGAIHFGSDGKLYIGVGENATGSNAQLMTNLLGKILRINPDGSIPTDNPYYGTASGQNRAIWAIGLRNPFTFAFQPGTGRMFINDVGQSAWEEINDGIAGSNYGWPTSEGPDNVAGFRAPLEYYDHSQGCAIAGGVFYNPATTQFPTDYTGDYFYADLCGNWIRRYDIASDTSQNFAANTPSRIVDLDLDSNGSLYYLARQGGGTNGVVYRIRYCALPSSADLSVPPIRNYFTTSTPTLTWARVSWAVSYEVRVDNISNFTSPEYHNDLIAGSTPFVTTDALHDCLYFWQVRAKGADGKWGLWSKTDVFIVNTQ